jgi:hypothetical protein
MKQSKIFLKVFLAVLSYIIITGTIYSRIDCNGSGNGFQLPKDGIVVGDNSIETYIVRGGGYFLKSHSDILLLLHKVEMADINGSDYNEWQSIVKSALDNMRKAKETYGLLIKTAEATPYNQEVIAVLAKFDYASFAQANDLNEVIFKKVEQHLAAGDITGYYKSAYAAVCAIEKLLVLVQDEVSLNKMPGLPLLWKLNGLYADKLIAGQYVAMIFNAI